MDGTMRQLTRQVSDEAWTDKPPKTHGGQQPLRGDMVMCLFCFKVLNVSTLSGNKKLIKKDSSKWYIIILLPFIVHVVYATKN